MEKNLLEPVELECEIRSQNRIALLLRESKLPLEKTMHLSADLKIETRCPECYTKQPIYYKFGTVVVNEFTQCYGENHALIVKLNLSKIF